MTDISAPNLDLPRHIGFIMDGNRRWGKKHGLKNAITGTAEGVETLARITEETAKMGIGHITVFAFSHENWKRSQEEVDYLMGLFAKAVTKFAQRVKESGIRVKFVGRTSDFSDEVQETIRRAEESTKECKIATLNIAASYGGRAEIVDATKKIIESGLDTDLITEEIFSNYIYEHGQPDLDLIVRTGGTPRLSGFMLWQSSYSEIYFTDVLWPDFDKKELDKALKYYAKIKRNFGK